MNKPEGTPAALLDAAEEVFAELGFEGASVREITRRAGANLGAITYHFGSKAKLFNAVMLRAQTGLLSAVEEAAASAGTPLARLETIVRAHFNFLSSQPRFRRLILQVLLLDTTIPAPAAEMLRKGLGIVASVVTEGQAAGQIRPGDPRLMALAVMSQPLMLNVIRPILRRGPGIDLDNPAVQAVLLDNAIQFIRRGVAPREAED